MKSPVLKVFKLMIFQRLWLSCRYSGFMGKLAGGLGDAGSQELAIVVVMLASISN